MCPEQGDNTVECFFTISRKGLIELFGSHSLVYFYNLFSDNSLFASGHNVLLQDLPGCGSDTRMNAKYTRLKLEDARERIEGDAKKVRCEGRRSGRTYPSDTVVAPRVLRFLLSAYQPHLLPGPVNASHTIENAISQWHRATDLHHHQHQCNHTIVAATCPAPSLPCLCLQCLDPLQGASQTEHLDDGWSLEVPLAPSQAFPVCS